jgi:hypothetical protein
MKMRRFCFALGLLLALMLSAPSTVTHAQIICVSNNVPPPELPFYEQPPIPAPGYLWIPGYWAGSASGYFWVPGTWVLPPAVGLLWTPGYWGWRDGIYVWTAGYWGPHIGFYGGINYGFGYTGVGYWGGRWENGVFAYNRTVNNFGSVAITSVYEQTVTVEAGASKVSFNGGSGGTTAKPTPQEEAAVHEQHVAAVPAQLQHERTASSNKALLASENHGRPPIAATAKPNEFAGKGVMAAREAAPETTLPAKPAGGGAIAPKANEPKGVEKEERPGKGPATVPGGKPPKPTEAEVEHPPKAVHTQPSPPSSGQGSVKPEQPPARPAPAQASAKSVPPPPPQPACPAGKKLVEVNGHPTCK